MGSDPGRLAGPESGREDGFAHVDHIGAKRRQLVVKNRGPIFHRVIRRIACLLLGS